MTAVRRAAKLAHRVVRLTGITQVVLGIVLWTGIAYRLLPVQMLVGAAFVLAGWVLAGLAARSGLTPPLTPRRRGLGCPGALVRHQPDPPAARPEPLG